jgi:hypothetical protein
MRKLLILTALICLSATPLLAAEKSKTVIQCDIARTAVDSAASKVEGNKEAVADLERAKAALKSADDCYNAGKSFFGSVSPEADKEMKLAVDAAELATAAALSHVDYAKAASELEAIDKQTTVVKAKLKLFDDRKAELERLRAESVASQKISKELETIKAEKAALATQVEQLNAERSRADKLKIEQLELTRKLDEAKAENARLSGLLEKQSKPVGAAAPAADDTKKK